MKRTLIVLLLIVGSIWYETKLLGETNWNNRNILVTVEMKHLINSEYPIPNDTPTMDTDLLYPTPTEIQSGYPGITQTPTPSKTATSPTRTAVPTRTPIP